MYNTDKTKSDRKVISNQSGIIKLVKTIANGRVRIVDLLYPSFFAGQSFNHRHG